MKRVNVTPDPGRRYATLTFRLLMFRLLTLGVISLGCGVALPTFLLSTAVAQVPSPQSPSPEKRLRTVTVTGRGVENIPATLAQVTLGVEAQGKTAQVVQQEVARRSAAVVALLRSRNVEKLETTGVNLNPNYTYTNNRQQLVGYTGSNTVSFRLPTERAGSLLDEAVQAGASRIQSISFTATEDAIKSARQRALRAATLDAQSQSQAVLSTLNLQPAEVTSIQINSVNAPPPGPVRFRATMTNQEQATTPVIGGEQQVEASVTLEIRY
jgi:uncharacterized protein